MYKNLKHCKIQVYLMKDSALFINWYSIVKFMLHSSGKKKYSLRKLGSRKVGSMIIIWKIQK